MDIWIRNIIKNTFFPYSDKDSKSLLFYNGNKDYKITGDKEDITKAIAKELANAAKKTTKKTK